eukprot:960805-Rhodomonas_salina.2
MPCVPHSAQSHLIWAGRGREGSEGKALPGVRDKGGMGKDVSRSEGTRAPHPRPYMLHSSVASAI